MVPRRIAIIGNAGGGKSRLALALSSQFSLPLYRIDDVQWQPGWSPTPLHLIAAKHHEWVARERWIIDGWGSPELLRRRFEMADAIVLVDFPLWRHYWWAAKRQLKAMIGFRRDWPPPGCSPWPVTRRLFRLMRRIHREVRPQLLAMLAEPDIRDRVIMIHHPRQIATLSTELSIR